MTPKIRILVAEDHLIARVGVSAIINMQTDMKVVAEAADGWQAVAAFREHSPDVTLLDMRMPVLSGPEAAAEIRSGHPDARIIALSTYGGAEEIRRALATGIQSYLTKDVLHGELLRAIRAVHGGKRYLPREIEATLRANPPVSHLSPREIEVLRLIAHGLANKQIAYSLGIADDTAKNHVKSILAKLGAQDRTQAATMAISRGIIRL